MLRHMTRAYSGPAERTMACSRTPPEGPAGSVRYNLSEWPSPSVSVVPPPGAAPVCRPWPGPW